MESIKTVGLFYRFAYRTNETFNALNNFRIKGFSKNQSQKQKSVEINNSFHPFRVKKEIFEKLLKEIPTDECPVFGCNKKKSINWPTCFSCNVISEGDAPRDINAELLKRGAIPLLNPQPRPTLFKRINLEEQVYKKVFGKIQHEEFDSDEELVAHILKKYPEISQEKVVEIVEEAKEKLRENFWVPKIIWNYLFDKVKIEFDFSLRRKNDLPSPEKIHWILREWLPLEEASFRKEVGERVVRAVINHLELQPIRYKL